MAKWNYDKLCGTKGEDGAISPREVIYHIAYHTPSDVFLSHEHFGSEDGAYSAILQLMKDNPNSLYSVVKYVRVRS
jgi:hypothetical protein